MWQGSQARRCNSFIWENFFTTTFNFGVFHIHIHNILSMTLTITQHVYSCNSRMRPFNEDCCGFSGLSKYRQCFSLKKRVVLKNTQTKCTSSHSETATTLDRAPVTRCPGMSAFFNCISNCELQQLFTRIKIHVYNVEPWSGDHMNLPKCGFTTVLNIQESIFVFLFFVDRTHERRIRWNGIGAKQKKSLFRRQFNAFANHIVELPHSQVGRYQIFLLVNVGNVGRRRSRIGVGFFTNHWHSVGIFGANPFRLGLSLICHDKKNNKDVFGERYKETRQYSHSQLQKPRSGNWLDDCGGPPNKASTAIRCGRWAPPFAR
jgi:hypothetical protein